MENTIRILKISFSNEIKPFEIPLLRGALLQLLGENANVLFHNHQGGGFRYSYPLIQYKRIGGKAAVVCLNEGVDIVGEILSKGITRLNIGERVIELETERVSTQRHLAQVWNSSFKYRITKWLPLNKANYETYKTLETVGDRVAFLEKILAANILSFLKGLGIWLDKEVVCRLLNLSEPYLVKNKGVRLMAFDIEFKANISLPDYVGIGKNASIGYGVLTRIREKENNKKQ